MRTDDGSAAAARLKSYTGQAIVALVVYFIFWPVGLVLNLVWRSEAKRMERVAGTSLPGVGCLTWLLVFQIVLAAFMVLLVLGAIAYSS
ncbi:MAG TPA: hypothetical protein VIH05_01120 [Tepidiformaceae bacterium]